MDGYDLKYVTRTELPSYNEELQKAARDALLREKETARTAKMDRALALVKKRDDERRREVEIKICGVVLEDSVQETATTLKESSPEGVIANEEREDDDDAAGHHGMSLLLPNLKGYGWRDLPTMNQITAVDYFEPRNHPVALPTIPTPCKLKYTLVGTVDPVEGIPYQIDAAQLPSSPLTEFVSDLKELQASSSAKTPSSDEARTHNRDAPNGPSEEERCFQKARKSVLQGFGKDRLSKIMDDHPPDSKAFFDIDRKDINGNTLFIMGCQRGNRQLAKFFLQRGAHINEQNNIGNSAVHYLFKYRYEELATYLIDNRGASDQLRNLDGLTCYEMLLEDEDEEAEAEADTEEFM
jgi:hypothetical protein